MLNGLFSWLCSGSRRNCFSSKNDIFNPTWRIWCWELQSSHPSSVFSHCFKAVSEERRCYTVDETQKPERGKPETEGPAHLRGIKVSYEISLSLFRKISLASRHWSSLLDMNSPVICVHGYWWLHGFKISGALISSVYALLTNKLPDHEHAWKSKLFFFSFIFKHESQCIDIHSIPTYARNRNQNHTQAECKSFG